mmetsp:Transcript_94612/g.164159  ORF Transcript_94612/g.164159 Transcript_94612/m.164159 type:complete len:205 (+) Transcript_94612:165-779(+)
MGDWSTSAGHIGVGHVDRSKAQNVQGQRVAGMTTAECGYHLAANDFPKFERQKIRAIHDEGILNGAKAAHPEMLRRYPNRERHDEKPPTGGSGRSGDWNRTQMKRPPSGRSGRSNASRRSVSSLRSVGSSVASSLPPSGYFRQAAEPSTMYQTSNALYGAGGHEPKEPVPGREAWMLGRGGGQMSSYDSCLVHKGRHVPLISQA